MFERTAFQKRPRLKQVEGEGESREEWNGR
jgi:hypothetical protein